MEIWYSGQDPQTEGPLTAPQAMDALSAFGRDMVRDNSAIVKLALQAITPVPPPPPPPSDPGDPYGDPMWGEIVRSFDAWWERRFGRRRRGDYRGRG